MPVPEPWPDGSVEGAALVRWSVATASQGGDLHMSGDRTDNRLVAAITKPARDRVRSGGRAADATEISERELVRSAQRGSDEALEELFRRHWRHAHRAAYLIVHDGAAAEDIAQEAFIAAIRALDRFDRRRPFGPWLHRIAVNRAIDWSRAARARGEQVDEAIGERAEPYSGDDPDRFAEADLVVGALAALAPEHRAVIVLRYLLEYTPGEIAKLLELPRGTVNSRLRRGLDTMARELTEVEP